MSNEISTAEVLSPPPVGLDGVRVAACHALAWLVIGNAVGFYLSLLQWLPWLQAGEWSYGRWMPLHLNLQLYGWTSVPLLGWLFSLYDADQGRAAGWTGPSIWAWSAALGVGCFYWLNGETSGKLFLDWCGGALLAFLAAQVMLWVVLLIAWKEHSPAWTPRRRLMSLLSLAGLALVPISLWFASSPTVYPPIDRSTGGPTGSSLQGSALIVVGLMLLLPRITGAVRVIKPSGKWAWTFFAISWLVFGVTESIGGTHRDFWQIGAMGMLLPWVWWIPHEWRKVAWPEGTIVWRTSLLVWWGVLVVSGVMMYQPGVLDRIKFTQALVAHSHLAMAGFTTSYAALTLVLLTGRKLGGATAVLWQLSTLTMILLLAWMGWREGAEAYWMVEMPSWRTTGLQARSGIGAVMLLISLHWWREARR